MLVSEVVGADSSRFEAKKAMSRSSSSMAGGTNGFVAAAVLAGSERRFARSFIAGV